MDKLSFIERNLLLNCINVKRYDLKCRIENVKFLDIKMLYEEELSVLEDLYIKFSEDI